MPRDPFAALAKGSAVPAPAPKPADQPRDAAGVRDNRPKAPEPGTRSRRDPLAALAQTETPAIEPGDGEGEAAEELSEVLKGFRSRAKVEDQRFELATDGGFYAVLVFPSRDHRDAFFDGAKSPEARELQFINGVRLAHRLGIPLPPEPTLKHSHRSAGPWLAAGTIPPK